MIFFFFLLKSSVVLAILTTAYWWLVRRETFLGVNRWLLWVNVAAVLLLPLLPMPDWQWLPDQPAQVVQSIAQVPASLDKPTTPTISNPPSAITALPVTQSPKTTPKWYKPDSVMDWIIVIYGVVAAVLLVRFLVQLVALWRLRQRGVSYLNEEGILLVESSDLSAPFSFFKWVFFNPAHHTNEEWAQVYTHERVHALAWHSADMVVAELFKIMYWFNPFAWWHQRLVQETLEYVTDRAVLNSGVQKQSYQYHLLRSTLSVSNTSDNQNLSTP